MEHANLLCYCIVAMKKPRDVNYAILEMRTTERRRLEHMLDTSLTVEYVSTEELREYRNNSKLHTTSQVEQIESSIEQFGFNSPILAWHNSNGEPEIVAGHGRLMAARNLGIEELPVVFLDHMSDEQRRAFNLVENQLNLETGFDLEKLQVELDSIIGIDMEQFDFDLGVSIDEFDEDFTLPDGDSPEYKTVSLHMSPEQHEIFEDAMASVDAEGDEGNAAARKVCEVIRQWRQLKM